MQVSVLSHMLGWVKTFAVLYCLDAIEDGCWKRASVRAPFLGSSPCGASSAVSRIGYLVIHGAAGLCRPLRVNI